MDIRRQYAAFKRLGREGAKADNIQGVNEVQSITRFFSGGGGNYSKIPPTIPEKEALV